MTSNNKTQLTNDKWADFEQRVQMCKVQEDWNSAYTYRVALGKKSAGRKGNKSDGKK